MANSWPDYITIASEHENLKNWQYQAVFAEEGKKKEIISYFDGSLRNRQTVTRINSNNEAIVGENVYDNQGRSAIQILPTPVENSALRYYPELNKNTDNDVFTHYDFDFDSETEYCVSEAVAMSTASGASRYYSTSSSPDVPGIQNNWQDYVPDAGGFPYVQMEYTPDNTGRIRRQSGVGADYTIDGDHATEYYYLQPQQEQLNRLFGLNVGIKSRYKKNLVIDANGQISVSYLDPQGRVIATALAGVNDEGASGTNLMTLASHDDLGPNADHGEVTNDLLNKLSPTDADSDLDDNLPLVTGAHGAAVDALNFNTQYESLGDDSPHDFEYEVTTGVYTDACMAEGVAYPFAYNLSIDLRDDCGTTKIGEAVNELVGLEPPTNYIGSTGTTLTINDLSALLPAGAYTLDKLISVNEDTLNAHLAHYLANLEPDCLPDFFEVTPIDCSDDLPEDSEFYLDPIFDMNSCLVQSSALLADLMPGGQYGSTEEGDLVSVFSETNALPFGEEHDDIAVTPHENWKNPFTPYQEDDGTGTGTLINSYITDVILEDGVYTPELTEDGETAFDAGGNVLPQHLVNVSDFLTYWKASWAKSLEQYHPEYEYQAYYAVFCNETSSSAQIERDGLPENISSETFNTALLSINTYAEARSITNIFEEDLLAAVFDPTITQTLRGMDPYFNIDYNTTAPSIHPSGAFAFKRDLMDLILEDYKADGVTAYSLWERMMKLVICPVDIDGDCGYATLPADATELEGPGFGLSTDQLNQLWNLYKVNYLAEKHKIDQVFVDVYAIENSFYHGFIGNETPTTGNLSGFLYYPEFLADADADGSMNIIDLYADAVDASAVDDELYPWMYNPFTSAFATKEQRYAPIYAGYDPSLPEDVVFDELAVTADASYYEQTGKCALELDMSLFLTALTAKDELAPGSSILADDLLEFSTELYTALGGLPGGTPITISTSADGSGNLVISVSNAGVGALDNIVLNKPSAVDYPSFTWASVDELDLFYYVPASFSDYSESRFEVLAKTTIAGEYVEIVITGQTDIQISECFGAGGAGVTSALCRRDKLFAGDLAAAFNQLYDYSTKKLKALPVGTTLAATEFGGWFSGSEIATQLSDNPLDPTTKIFTDPVAGVFELLNSESNKSLKIEFDVIPLPTNIGAITGAVFDNATSEITFYCITNLGAELTITASVVLLDQSVIPPKSIPLEFYCPCTEEFAVTEAFENAFKTIEESTLPLVEQPENLIALSSVLFPLNSPLPKITSVVKDGVSGIMEISFSGLASCELEITDGKLGETVDVSDIVSVHSLEVVGNNPLKIVGFGIKPDDSVVPIIIAPSATGSSCFSGIKCLDCIPAQRKPESCTELYSVYQSAMTTLNSNLTDPADEELFRLYTIVEFCDFNYAYATEAYLQYMGASYFDVESKDDEYYLSIGAFSSTELINYYLDDDANTIADAVESYYAYENDTETEHLSWTDYISAVYIPTHGKICPPTPLYYELDSTVTFPCNMYTANVDTVNAANQEEIYLEQLADNFRALYLKKAIESLVETFTTTYQDKEFHYTLYYYDQAGNLVQTVPPKGVDRFENTMDNGLVNLVRNDYDEHYDPVDDASLAPNHTFQTSYEYNSLNQLVYQNTPDGGESRFGYDELGRLVVSQNAKQKANTNGSSKEEQFSYTKYDGLGRIIEVGELTIDGDGYNFNEDGKFVDPLDNLVDVSDDSFPFNLGIDLIGIEEVTRTQYDELFGIDASAFEDYASDNTRNRITGVFYFDILYSGGMVTSPLNFDNATFYDYDVHGNVKELIQDIADDDLADLGHSKKSTKYDYDLVSGNVKHVTYQADEVDQFIHEYEYDADNRITNVRTSKDDVIWEQDAKYFYYDHGPLARTEIGDKKVQASDFAYTIQGWLKGVNSEGLVATNDQGKDAASGLNRMNSKDVYGYSLHYFDNDYTARHGNDFLDWSTTAVVYDHNKDLYNGNIKEMYTASTNTSQEYIGTSHTWYNYDQLNRIRSMDQQRLYETETIVNRYASTYIYDANGNLDELTREAWTGSDKKEMDMFKYYYTTGTNQLRHVKDNTTETYDFEVDLKTQLDDNYDYDEIGQLISDNQEEIEKIEWKVTGKVHKITRTTVSTKDNLEFVYDAMGNRIIKKVTNQSNELVSKTYYIRDAQGNCMSIYTLKEDIILGTPETVERNLSLTERSIYGSSRVGVENINEVIASDNLGNINVNTDLIQTIGDKRYELSNHLGNVLQVVTDRKLAVSDDDVTVDYYVADVVSQSDYFPFGMLLPNRNESTPEYRYGFNGMEKDDEVTNQEGTSYDFGARFYNPRVGRWLSRDALEFKYPYLSPYNYVANSPTTLVDKDGKDHIYFDASGNVVFIEKTPGANIYLQTIEVQYESLGFPHVTIDKLKILDYDDGTVLNYVNQTQTWHEFVSNLQENDVWIKLTDQQRENILFRYTLDFNTKRLDSYGYMYMLALSPVIVVAYLEGGRNCCMGCKEVI